ncbi:MAG TPA: crossover junction endodeoxyribonuclease RuvC [Anaerolineales bacterium]|nr:crossover junction endodeoxyribonuclease RuvC [Anaerolineales bacterium]
MPEAPARLLLGIDPGMARTGYGLVRQVRGGEVDLVDFGVIETEAGDELGRRLLAIEAGIQRVLQTYSPESSAVERLFFERNVSTAMSVGQARGVALLTLARHGLPITEYSPVEIKQAVAGYGSADKRQMQTMVRTLLRMDELPRPDDAADALAVAICHAHMSRTRQRMEEAR